jgi:Asp-tRNA(Asn)/Glu-tRNA(Gln) amidotransferase A subunit family amidase
MDLCATPAVELARLIRARELSAAELLSAVLARIADANPALNAIVTLAADQATAAAAALDAQAARGSFAGPLHGLPIAVKDLGVVGPIARTAPDAALLLARDRGRDHGARTRHPFMIAGSFRCYVPQTVPDHEANKLRPGKARVLPRQDEARRAASCMASAPNRRSRWSLTATRPR